MMSGGIISDQVRVKNGADFSFVCSKIPFAISCLSDFRYDNNLIDLDLVNKMKIPLTNIKVTRMTIAGQSVRSVGFINQTIQCVRKGQVTGTIHLNARVIRDLYTMFDVDCVASSRTYTRLMGRKPPDPPIYNDDDELEHLGNLDDVPDEETEGHEVKEEGDDHNLRTDDDKGIENQIGYSKMDAV